MTSMFYKSNLELFKMATKKPYHKSFSNVKIFGTLNTPEDLAIVITAYAFGLIWACNIYITTFGKKSTNYAK